MVEYFAVAVIGYGSKKAAYLLQPDIPPANFVVDSGDDLGVKAQRGIEECKRHPRRTAGAIALYALSDCCFAVFIKEQLCALQSIFQPFFGRLSERGAQDLLVSIKDYVVSFAANVWDAARGSNPVDALGHIITGAITTVTETLGALSAGVQAALADNILRLRVWMQDFGKALANLTKEIQSLIWSQFVLVLSIVARLFDF